MIQISKSNRKVSATDFMGSLFVRLFVASGLFVLILGAVSTGIQIANAISISDRRVQQVIQLHENELLNELALLDFAAINQHLEILQRQLNSDSVCLVLNERTIAFPAGSTCADSADAFLRMIGASAISEVSLANEFGDYRFLLRVDSTGMLTESIIRPMLISAIFVFFFAMIPLAVGYYLIFKLARGNFLRPLSSLTTYFNQSERNSEGGQVIENTDSLVKEIEDLRKAAERFYQLAAREAIADLASQVSHDIRSPLTALNLMIGKLQQIPEQERLIIGSAVNRINDIANTLLTRSKDGITQVGDNSSPVVELLPALVDSVVSEKRIQYQDRMGLEIACDFNQSYASFVRANVADLKRVISNLINNAVEALPDYKGRVLVTITKGESTVCLSVSDNGKGIPPELLSRIGEKGVSHGKQGSDCGFGLGISHARKIISAIGGNLSIRSEQGHGTSVSIELPLAPSPSWVVEHISLDPKSQVISVDDDMSIHGVWQSRISEVNGNSRSIKHLAFTSVDEFREWVKNESREGVQKTFLVDYELFGQAINGLDIIEELDIGRESILVTSRYEECSLRSRCEQLGVRLVPKNMAPIVPIEV